MPASSPQSGITPAGAQPTWAKALNQLKNAGGIVTHGFGGPAPSPEQDKPEEDGSIDPPVGGGTGGAQGLNIVKSAAKMTGIGGGMARGGAKDAVGAAEEMVKQQIKRAVLRFIITSASSAIGSFVVTIGGYVVIIIILIWGIFSWIQVFKLIPELL